MKLLALLFFFITTADAQVARVESNYPEAATPMVEQFIKDGLDFDFYARHHIETHLKGIYFLPQEEFKHYLNVEDHEKTAHIGKRYGEWIIIIDITYKDSPGDLERIMYHELGHLFGLEHDNQIQPAIMNETVSTNLVMDGHSKWRLFTKIKKIPPVNYRN